MLFVFGPTGTSVPCNCQRRSSSSLPAQLWDTHLSEWPGVGLFLIRSTSAMLFDRSTHSNAAPGIADCTVTRCLDSERLESAHLNWQGQEEKKLKMLMLDYFLQSKNEVGMWWGQVAGPMFSTFHFCPHWSKLTTDPRFWTGCLFWGSKLASYIELPNFGAIFLQDIAGQIREYVNAR